MEYSYVLRSIRHVRLAVGDSCKLYSEEEEQLLVVDSGELAMDGDGYMLMHAHYVVRTARCTWLRAGRRVEATARQGQCAYYLFSFTCMPLPGGQQADPGEEHEPGAAGPRRSLPCETELECAPFARIRELAQDILAQAGPSDGLQIYRQFVRFQELLLLLFSHNVPQVLAAPARLGEEEGIARSIEYIQGYYRSALTVEHLADIARIERWKYTRLFKEATGQVPLQYLNAWRIGQAKQWLAGGAEKLSAIAEQAGFTNEYYFNRRFKQAVGITPGQYRRIHQEPIRIVAPYLEDFIVALGLTPVVQYSHARWGKQDYLQLEHVPAFDELELATNMQGLSSCQPDLILLQDRYEPIIYDRCRQISPTCVLRELSENWRELLRTVGDYFGRMEQAELAISSYEAKASRARRQLQAKMSRETVAMLRISADAVHMYTADGKGFGATVLFQDLGFVPYAPYTMSPGPCKMIRLEIEDLQRFGAKHLFVVFDKWHSQQEGAERSLLTHPIWRRLPAVRANQVYEMDFLTWMNNGVLSNLQKLDDIMSVLG